jgi:hypothetical protein
MKKSKNHITAFLILCLSFYINISVADTALPGNVSVFAGNDTTITLPNNFLVLNGSAFSSTGNIASYSWAKIAGSNSFVINNPNTPIPTISGLTEGVYTLVFTVVDDEQSSASDTINVFVSSRILIDFGATLTTSPDSDGKYWNNVTSGSNGVKISNAVTIQNTLTNIGLTVVDRIDGTFNVGGPGVNTGNTTGSVGDYPASATTDYAFSHPSATTGRWRLTGLDTGTTYLIKFWGSRSGISDPRIIQIKTEDDLSYQSYDATNNSDYNNAAYFIITGKSLVNFDIKNQTGSAFGYICLMDIQKVVNQTSPNINPIAYAGADIRLILPGNSITLDGSLSNDPDGNIVTYEWRKLSGPAALNINSPNNAITTLTNLFEGTYQMELKVIDNEGAFDLDTIKIQVGTRILIDFGMDTTLSPDPIFGNYWNLVTSGTADVKIVDAVTTSNSSTNLDFEILSRIDGTFNLAGPGVNNENASLGVVGDYPGTATADYAFADPSATNGQWKFSGMDSTKTYTFKFWGSRVASNPRVIEIKNSEDTIWSSYDAANNADYNTAAFITLSGKTNVTFDIRVQNPSFFGYINVIDINYSNPCVATTSTLDTTVCDSFVWNGVTYTTSGNYSVLSINAAGCDSTAFLNLTVNNTSTSNEAITQCDSIIWNGNVYTQSGVYYFITNNALGCDSIASLNLTISQSTSSSDTVVVCNTYSWNGNTFTNSGVYSFGTTNAQGCDSVATLYLTIVTPPSVNAGTDQQLIAGATVTLQGIVNGVYDVAYWSNGSGTFTPNNFNFDATYTLSASEVSAQISTLILVASSFCGTFSDTVLLLYTLPVSLTKFNGIATSNGNFLTWTTSSEFNNRGFELQRSNNGVSFNALTFVPSIALNGNSNQTSNYNFVDKQYNSGTQYYRLKQTDYNNRSTFSDIVKINRVGIKSLAILNVSPNPAQSNIYLNVEATQAFEATFVITDASGKKMSTKSIVISAGSQQIPLNIETLASGSYFIQIISSNHQSNVVGFIKN